MFGNLSICHCWLNSSIIADLFIITDTKQWLLIIMYIRLLLAAFINIYCFFPDYLLLHSLYFIRSCCNSNKLFPHCSWLFIAAFPIINCSFPKYLLLHSRSFIAAMPIFYCCNPKNNCCIFNYQLLLFQISIAAFPIIYC